METIKFRKGDFVCRKRKYGREYYRVTSARGKNLTVKNENGEFFYFSKKEMYKYLVKVITVQPHVLERMKEGNQTIVYGPSNCAWLSICVGLSHQTPDIVKINDGWKEYAYFSYVEAAKLYRGCEIFVRLQIDRRINL